MRLEIIAKRADLVITVSHPIPAQILITRITLGSDYVCLDSSDSDGDLAREKLWRNCFLPSTVTLSPLDQLNCGNGPTLR
jgi:hypothetical protein